MEVSKAIQKCVTITRKQEDFLVEEPKFKLSKFVQVKLDEYIKFKKDYNQFMEVKNEETV